MIEQFTTTEHYNKRAGNRGLDKEIQEMVYRYGAIYDAGAGAVVYWLNRKTLERFLRSRNIGIYIKKKLMQAMDAALVISDDHVLITAMHCHRRQKHWKVLCA